MACAGQSAAPKREAGAAPDLPPAPADAEIVLDGAVDDWRPNASVVADSTHLYFRVKVAGTDQTLQGMARPLLARFDLDGSAETGARYASPRIAQDFGTDLEIVFSPKGPGDERGRGVSISAVGADGSLRPIALETIDFLFTPSYAAEWYEARISLAALLEAGLPRPEGGGAGRLVYVLGDGAGGVAGWAEPAWFRWPVTAQAPAPADVAAPARPQDAIRIVSWNVLRSRPSEEPAPFARVLSALAPDIVLVQEWDEPDADGIAAWFETNVGDQWRAIKGEGRGVAVVTRWPAALLGPEALEPEGMDRPVRFIGALVETDRGSVAVGSAHLKCCGYAGSEEDTERMVEAIAIRDAIGEALAELSPGALVVGGDMNLVGSRPPLEALMAGADLDGSDLEVAEAFTLGDRTQVTWSAAGAIFAPGRLDYLVYSGSSAELAHAFVLDTAVLSETALGSMGLARGDSRASDHRPLVLDIRMR